MNVLIIGLGSIAKKHIDALNQIDKTIKIFALRSHKTSESYLNITNLFDLNQIKNLSIDFIIISSPTFKHVDNIESLIEFNIPLFIEKPLFHTLEVNDVLNKIKKQNIKTYVACNLRFLDCLKFAKDYIVGKRINEVNIYCGSYLPDWRPERDYKMTYSANKEQGGGVHIDLIHEIDYAYWLFGKPKKTHKLFSSKSSLDINSFDYANYILDYDNFNANIVLNYFRKDSKRTLEILLEEETITVDILKNKVYDSNSNVLFKSDKTITDTYTDQLQFFIDYIATNKNEFNTVSEAYEILKICLQND